MNVVVSKLSSDNKESFNAAVSASLILATALFCQFDVIEVELG